MKPVLPLLDMQNDRHESVASSAEVEESIPKRFALIAARHANQVAVSTNRMEWTYAELDQRSNALAVQILARSDGNSEPVALLMEHGAVLIAAILAVLKTGKIFLPLDPNNSIECLAAVLADSRAGLLIADQKNATMADSLTSGELPILRVSDDFASILMQTNFPEVSPKAGARLMYTSGSTGAPKGVWQNHCGIVHDANVYREMIQLTAEDRVSLLTSCSFAAADAPLFGALLNGATLCPFYVRSQGVERLASWLRQQRVTIYHSIPSVFREVAGLANADRTFADARLIRLSGESIFPGDVELFRQHCPNGCQLTNVLASTETGLISAAILDKHAVLPNGRVTVGRPVAGVDVFLVDEQGKAVENGCNGKIAVRSAYLRQGYWRRPDETSEKFRRDPRVPDTRIFITNDMGHFLPDGNLEHLGRTDRVVKIRGLRVDLAEVEAALHATDLFQEVVTTTLKDISGGCQLVTYVVPRSGNDYSPHACRQAAQQLLPLSSHLVMVEELPRLASGKIDRVYLSKKAFETFADKPRTRGDPVDAIEFQLVRIWENILAVEGVGATDNFFALGGDSLAAATMFAAVEKYCGVDLPASTLLEAPTIKELAKVIRCGGLSETGLRLVALRLGGSRPPLHYVTYPRGNALEFRFVARHFTNDQPVFAFQPPTFDGHPRSVEEMAKSYIQAMRVNQPRGPYYLCGASFGGVVAFEMARQLEAAGEEVAFLGVLDSYGGEYPKPRRCLAPRKRLKQALLRFLPHTCYTFNLSSFKSGVKEQIKRWLVRRMIMLDGWLRFRLLLCPLRLRNLYIAEICRAARRRYKLLPFTGKIDLFRAEHQPPNDLFEEDPLLGWDGMATGGIDVHQIPGHHYMYLVDPMTSAVVAARLEACLDKRRTEISARKYD